MIASTNKTSLSFQILKDLVDKNRNFCSTDNDDCLTYLQRYLPFTIYKYDRPYNGWQIPPKWDLVSATIKDSSEAIIYEVDHPLKIIGLSHAFSGKVSKEELLKHLHYDHRFDDAIPYHFRQFYRPWDRDWGFCVPKTFYDSLSEKEYLVDIQTKESEGYLQVAEYHLKGRCSHTFAFVAHLDHPGMANDDLAGVSVGVELFKRLSEKKLKFSYKLLLVPEIIGSEFYLGQNTTDKKQIMDSCFLEMLGSKTPLALQYSNRKNSLIEKKILKCLKNGSFEYRTGSFKSIICNDEYVFESHQIPMCSISRFPYPEYHSSKDNLSIIDLNSLEESISLLERVVEEIEKSILIEKNFTGTPCFSNPKYNLYVDPGQRAFGTHYPKEIPNKRLLMDLITTQNKTFFLDDLSSEVDLPIDTVLNYLKKFENKNLVSIF